MIIRIALFKVLSIFLLLLYSYLRLRPYQGLSSKHHNRNNPHLGWSSKQNNCKTPISWQIRHEQFKAKRMKATCINNRSCKRMTTILLDSGMLEGPKNGGGMSIPIRVIMIFPQYSGQRSAPFKTLLHNGNYFIMNPIIESQSL